MLDLIINLFAILSSTVYYVFLISYQIGNFIIFGATYVTKLLGGLYYELFVLLKIVIEDFIIFLTDIQLYTTYLTNGITTTFGCVINLFTLLADGLKHYAFGIYYIVVLIPYAISLPFIKLFEWLGQLFVTLKHLIVLFGSGIWFILTLIPLGLVYSFTLSTYYVGRVGEEWANLAQSTISRVLITFSKIISFVTDVPLEAVGGLVAGFCILYVILKFHIDLYRFVEEKLSSFNVTLRLGRWRQLRTPFRRNVAARAPIRSPSNSRNRATGRRRANSSDGSDSDGPSGRGQDERYCVVCQDRFKCILILPCKHVCLCSECNKTLRDYDRTCPICRTYVEKTMKIFV